MKSGCNVKVVAMILQSVDVKVVAMNAINNQL